MTVRTRGAAEMTAAMVISGTISWFVVISGRPVVDVVLWRCVFGAAALLIVCAAMGLLGRDNISRRQLALAATGGIPIALNCLLPFPPHSPPPTSTPPAVSTP